MASTGPTLYAIQIAGEWASKTAPSFYTNIVVADQAQELRMLVEGELSEDVDADSEDIDLIGPVRFLRMQALMWTHQRM